MTIGFVRLRSVPGEAASQAEGRGFESRFPLQISQALPRIRVETNIVDCGLVLRAVGLLEFGPVTAARDDHRTA